MPAKATISLWFDGEAEQAARFYTGLFPESAMGEISRAPADYPAGKVGDVLTVEFTICGLPVLAINGGSGVVPNESFSLQIATDTQEETDRYWNALIADGGAEIQCGWCRDRWGYCWQIVPRALTRALADPDRALAGRVMEVMMAMTKIDIAAIKAARQD